MIVQHHEPFDLKSFFEKVKSCHVGIDFQDFDIFMMNDGEKHSFIVNSEGADRVKNALKCIMRSDNASFIIKRASEIIITIVRSSESKNPLLIEEIQYMNKYIRDLPESCDVVWGITEDTELGDEVKIILLANLKN